MSSTRNKLKGKKTRLASQPKATEPEPAVASDDQESRFCQVEVELIKPNPDQPRKHFNQASLEELAQSIKQKGLLQPVIIKPEEDGVIHLVAGERRLRASKIAGLAKIPAMITQGNSAEIAIIENLQREDLSPVEEAEALERMVKNYGYTQEQLAMVIGKAKSTVSEAISLNRLPEAIKDQVRRAEPGHRPPRRLLIEIAKQDTEKAMLKLWENVQAGNLKSDQVREITRTRKDSQRREKTFIVLDKIKFLVSSLKKLNFEDMESKNKAKIIAELDTLRKLIDEKID